MSPNTCAMTEFVLGKASTFLLMSFSMPFWVWWCVLAYTKEKWEPEIPEPSCCDSYTKSVHSFPWEYNAPYFPVKKKTQNNIMCVYITLYICTYVYIRHTYLLNAFLMSVY